MPPLSETLQAKFNGTGLELLELSADATRNSYRYVIRGKDDPYRQRASLTATQLPHHLERDALLLEAVDRNWYVINQQLNEEANFINCWPSALDAIADVLDYFEVGSARRLAKNVAHEAYMYRQPDRVSEAELTSCLARYGLATVITDLESRTVAGAQHQAIMVTCPHRDGQHNKITIKIYRDHTGRWTVRANHPIHQWGSFEHHWYTADQVVNDITNFWFGNGIRRGAYLRGKQAHTPEPKFHDSLRSHRHLACVS